MMSVLNILQCDIKLFLVAFIVILLLPFFPHHKVRYYGCFAVYVIISSAIVTLIIPFLLFRLWDVRNCVIGAEFMKHISKLVGIQWELRGGEILEVERGAVIVANHQSMFDVLGIFNIWKTMGKCSVVSKKELFYIWPFGLGAWMSGIVFIDRNRPNVAQNQLDDASRLVTKEQTKLWIFPEGTRNKNPDTLMPFKKGAFRIAVTCQVPIIPLVYSPYYFIDSEKKYFGRGRVIMQCLDPISTEGKTEQDIDLVIEDVWGKMMKQYELLKKEALK